MKYMRIIMLALASVLITQPQPVHAGIEKMIPSKMQGLAIVGVGVLGYTIYKNYDQIKKAFADLQLYEQTRDDMYSLLLSYKPEEQASFTEDGNISISTKDTDIERVTKAITEKIEALNENIRFTFFEQEGWRIRKLAKDCGIQEAIEKVFNTYAPKFYFYCLTTAIERCINEGGTRPLTKLVSFLESTESPDIIHKTLCYEEKTLFTMAQDFAKPVTLSYYFGLSQRHGVDPVRKEVSTILATLYLKHNLITK